MSKKIITFEQAEKLYKLEKNSIARYRVYCGFYYLYFMRGTENDEWVVSNNKRLVANASFAYRAYTLDEYKKKKTLNIKHKTN